MTTFDYSLGNHLDDDSRVVIRLNESAYKNTVISFNKVTLLETDISYEIDLLTCVKNGVIIEHDKIPKDLLLISKEIIRDLILNKGAFNESGTGESYISELD